MQPRFKLVGEEDGIILNNVDWFWPEIKAGYVSFKNGKGSSWTLLNSGSFRPDQLDEHKSSNNRRFIKKKGNCFFLPGFKLSIGSGYCYCPICWEWRCRKCHEPAKSRHLLDSLEVCHDCRTVVFAKKSLTQS